MNRLTVSYIVVFMLYATSLKELARLLNLAPSTVSKALKGHPDISESSRNRVREMVLKQSGLPFVFFDRILGDIDADRVLEDDFRVTNQAVSHLIAGGCKQIAVFSSSLHWIWAQRRQLGYIHSLQKHHIMVNRQLIVEGTEVRQLVNALISRYAIDGIFACHDLMAI